MTPQKAAALLAVAALAAACQESLEDRCAREARQYTEKKCPARIDATTTVDSFVFERATHTIHYYYTLSGAADNKEAIEAASPREKLLQAVRNSTTDMDYKEAGYNFTYTYHSQADPSLTLFEATFTPKDYSK